VVTFVVTASGMTILSIGAAFWGLVAGGLTALLLHRRPPSEQQRSPSETAAERMPVDQSS
jgi:benzoate membrane transport protein